MATDRRPTDLEVLKTVNLIKAKKGLPQTNSLEKIKIIKFLKETSFLDIKSEVKSEYREGDIYIIDADEGLSDITGYPLEELIGYRLTKFLVPRAPEVLFQMIDALEKDKVVFKSSVIQTKDGKFLDTFGILVKEKRNDNRKIYKELVCLQDSITYV